MSSAYDLRTFALADGGGPVKFPPGPYPSPASYFDAYAEELSRAATSIEPAGLERAAAILTEAYVRGARMFSCGIVEDLHQAIMHALAQYIRQSRMSADAISTVVF